MGRKSIATGNKYLGSASKGRPLIVSAVVTSTAVEGVSITSAKSVRSSTVKRATKRK